MSKKKRGVVEWTMHHHKIVVLLVAFLVGLGIYALPEMPKKEYPDFTIRNALVVGVYPGASTEQVDEQLTVPLEQYLLSYKGVDRKRTYSLTRNGVVYFVMELDETETSPRDFYASLRIDLEQFKMQLPSGVLPLMVLSEFGETSAILITLESESLTYRSLEKELGRLERDLRKLPIVSNIKSYGHQKEQLSLYLDKDKLAVYSLNTQQIMTQLYSGGFVTSAGVLDISSGLIPIHLNNSYGSEQEILEQPLYFDDSGNVLRVKDLGYIVREYPQPDSYITNNGRKCLLLSLEMSHGYNMVELGKQVDVVLKDFQDTLPDDVHIYRITDEPRVVSDSVYSFLKDMLISVLAVIAVMMIMLPVRVASVAATSIPITIFISIGVLYVLGFEINTVTLASLLVVLGMVVDDSIVVIDNYLNYLDHGMSRWKASITAANSYFRSIFSATLAISITFFPFLVALPEKFSEFIYMAPWAIFISLTISMGVAMLYIPYFQYFTIRKGIQQVVDKQKQKSRKGISLLELFGVFYERILQKAFKHPVIVVVVIIAFLVLPYFVYLLLPKRLMPMADRNQFVIEMYLPYGSSLKETEKLADSLRSLIQEDDRVLAVTSFIGTTAPRFQASYAPQIPGPHFGQFIINTPSHKVTEQLVKEYQKKYIHYFPDTYVRVRQLDYSMFSESEVEVRLIGEDKAVLMHLADSLIPYLSEIEYVANVRSDFGGYTHGLNLKTDPIQTARVGINPALLSLNLASRFSGVPVTSVTREGETTPVVMYLTGQEGAIEPEAISDEYFHGIIPGAAVPLRQIARLEPEWNISQIVRRNGMPTLTLLMDLEHGKISTDVFAQVKNIMEETEMPEGVHYEHAGTYSADKEMMPHIMHGVFIAVLLIFLILLFHFKKVSLAVIVMASTALSLLGAFVGTWIMGLPVSLTTFLGIVTLIGLVVRNGIIMFDYAELLRAGGYGVKEASFLAGCRRIRPIFQTSSSTAVAVIPMLITKDSLWAPMAATIFFGVFTSMFFVSLFMPVIYWLVYKKQDKAGEKNERTQKNDVAMKKALYLLILLSVLSNHYLSAQPYTLEECKQMAVEHNTRLKEKQLDEEIAKLVKKEASSYYLPNVSLVGLGFHASGPMMKVDMGMLGSMAMYEKGVFAGVTVFQPVLMGGKLLYANRLANTGIQAARLFTTMLKEEVLAQTEEYYWLLYSLYEKRNTVKIMRQLLDTLSRDVEQANKAGLLDKNEVLKVNLQKNTLESKHVELENGIFLATMALARQVGIPVDDIAHFQVSYTEDLLVTNPMELYVEPASVIDQRTEYKLLELGETAATLECKVEFSSYLPKIGIGAAYYYENFLAKDHWNGVIMAGIQIPVSDWYRGSFAIRQKRIEEQQARLNKEDGHQQLLMQIQQAWGALVEAYQKYLLAELAVSASKENARLSEDYFKAGTANVTELLVARGLLQENRDKKVDAMKDYQLAKSTYLQVTGR